MIINAYLERPCASGSLKYSILCENPEGDRISYGIRLEQHSQKTVLEESVRDITDDPDCALLLILFLFIEEVQCCHLRDVIEDLLPVEDSLPRILRSVAEHPGEYRLCRDQTQEYRITARVD